MDSPPGMHVTPPPGLLNGAMSKQIDLETEMRRLSESHQRLVNERLELETARMAQENALLRAHLQYNVFGATTPFLASGPVVQFEAPLPGQWSSPHDKSGQIDVSTKASDSSDGEAQTTVLVRNIPNSYTRERFLVLLDGEGFKCQYDLVYLPIDFNSRSGYGYAFINFLSENFAQHFREHFQGFNEWGVFSEKTCDSAAVATHQGLDANIQRYRNSPMMHDSVPDEFRPVVFEDGVRVPFPPPTRKLRVPQVRQRSTPAQ